MATIDYEAHCLGSPSESSSSSSSSSASSTNPKSDNPSMTKEEAASHKNEGFLKSAWHRLTHQHDNLPPENGKDSNAETDGTVKEERKASGSGSA